MKKIIIMSLAIIFGITTLLAQEKATRSKRARYNPNENTVKIIGSVLNMMPSEMKDANGNLILVDRDGNTYKTVTTGTQIWMAENLKTTRYNDGTTIPIVTDNMTWINLTTPAYCWFSNNENAKTIYGAIYNWYVVNTGTLCPGGWHVPSDAEWTTLELFLQNNGFNYDGTVDMDYDRMTNDKIAKSLASETYWAESTEKGSIGNTDYPVYRNKSGFNALPSGFREYYFGFGGLGESGMWWSATEDTEFNSNYCWYRQIHYDRSLVRRDHGRKVEGAAIRCVRD